MCAAIIAKIPFISVINKNIFNRRAPAVKYDHTASSGGLWLYPVNDNIRKMRTKRWKNQIILKLSPVDSRTQMIFRMCVWSCKIS